MSSNHSILNFKKCLKAAFLKKNIFQNEFFVIQVANKINESSLLSVFFNMVSKINHFFSSLHKIFTNKVTRFLQNKLNGIICQLLVPKNPIKYHFSKSSY